MPIFRILLQCCFSIFIFGIFLLGCSRVPSGQIKQTAPVPVVAVSFEQHEVITGTTKHQTILTGFLLGGPIAELAVVNIDENNARRLRIYAFSEDAWVSKLETTLRPEVLFVDMVTIGGHDRLITYEHGRLNWFDPDSMVERELMSVTINYNATDASVIPHIDITRDLNGDGLDDIVVPDIDGFWIATQLTNGSFSKPVKLGPPDPFLDKFAMDESRSYREVGINALTVFWYLSRLHQMDYDRDGHTDLVFWNVDHFDVYRQEASGMFSTVPETFTIDVPFDTDGAYSIAFGFSGENMFALISGFRENTKRRVLYTFRDMNGDRVTDMVILTLEGRSLGKQRSRYEVHFGTPTPNGTVFAQDVSVTIQPRGAAGALLPWGYSSQWLQDFDGDEDVEILFRDVKTGLGGMTRAMVGSSIAIDIELYQMKDGVYLKKPATKHKIRPKFDLFEKKRVFFPAVLLGDVNGDKRPDLLIGKSWEEMHLFLGTPGPKLLTQKPQKVTVAMPEDERNIKLVDLNKDTKQDILIYYKSSTEPHRVKMLIAQ
ncbi:MAG: VCBS repeat-containing protein [Candidatus Poribacteria bacterium]|nr:VCBS repeat-containing protein [Candidatus Poribacteria bacterium]